MGEPTPTTMAGFTPAWLTDELRRNEVIGAATTVAAVEHETLGTGEGFMGELARLTLTYDGDPGPATMIAKIPTQVEHNRARGRSLGVYEREVRLYAEILPNLPIPTPAVYSAVYEATGEETEVLAQMLKAEKLPLWLLRIIVRRAAATADVPPTVLLLEDLATEAEVGDQVAGTDLETVRLGLDVLAELHATTWGAHDLPDTHWMLGADVITRILHAGHRNSVKRFVKEQGHQLSDHSRALLRSIRRTGIKRRKRMYRERPQCLLHLDFRLDNLFLTPDGAIASVIDWQSSTPGPAAFDVSYFITGSLNTDVAESEVDALIEHYHRRLIEHGVGGYSLAELRSDYNESLLISLEAMPLGFDDLEFGDDRGRELVEGWIRRLDARLQRVPA